MAAPFDFSRPSPTIYDLSNAAGAVKLQKVAREFMEVVRETPDMNAEHIFSFCKLVEAAWLSRRYFERGTAVRLTIWRHADVASKVPHLKRLLLQMSSTRGW